MTIEDEIKAAAIALVGQPLSPVTKARLNAVMQGFGGIQATYEETHSKVEIKRYLSVVSAPRQPPETGALEVEEAEKVLLEFAASLYLGKSSLDGIEGEIRKAIAADGRLYLRSVSVSGNQVNVVIDRLVGQLVYDGLSEYNGEYFYG